MSYCWDWENTDCGHKVCCHDCPENTACDKACTEMKRWELCLDREEEEPSKSENAYLVEENRNGKE